MAKSVYNKDASVDFTKQPMFFGEDNAVQRFDTFTNPIFDKLTQSSIRFILETTRSFFTER